MNPHRRHCLPVFLFAVLVILRGAQLAAQTPSSSTAHAGVHDNDQRLGERDDSVSSRRAYGMHRGVFFVGQRAGDQRERMRRHRLYESNSANSANPPTPPNPRRVRPNPAASRRFPGRRGAARQSAGGRGGAVMEVTNTNDSGSGSLRACVQASGPRTCMFRVAGVFNITSGDNIATSPYLTIACQTAPGEVIIGGPNAIRRGAAHLDARRDRAPLHVFAPTTRILRQGRTRHSRYYDRQLQRHHAEISPDDATADRQAAATTSY